MKNPAYSSFDENPVIGRHGDPSQNTEPERLGISDAEAIIRDDMAKRFQGSIPPVYGEGPGVPPGGPEAEGRRFTRFETSMALRGVGGLSWWIHETMKEKGFWAGEKETRNRSEALMLIVSEIAEACEALRKGDRPDEHCPEFRNHDIELADAIIRILDYCRGFNIPIGPAIVAKMRFNEGRPPKHGKSF